MTVVLKWIDRAMDETSFKVYRNETLIEVLDAGSTSYTDIISVISGKGLSYYVEIYNDIGHAKSPTASVTCP